MGRADLILNEHVLNLWTHSEMEPYAQAVWDMLNDAYAKMGGFLGAHSKEELVRESALWKLTVRNGNEGPKGGKHNITAISVYKDKAGRKLFGGATAREGGHATPVGIDDIHKNWTDDARLKDRSAWAEVSGAPEAHFKSIGAKPVSVTMAAKLLHDKDIHPDPDGFHYTRLIDGKLCRKIIYGNPKN